MERMKIYKGQAAILRKDGKYSTRSWRDTINDLGKWIREREKFLREIYHFTKFDLLLNPAGQVFLNCERPEGKYNGRTLRRMAVNYTFTPIN